MRFAKPFLGLMVILGLIFLWRSSDFFVAPEDTPARTVQWVDWNGESVDASSLSNSVFLRFRFLADQDSAWFPVALADGRETLAFLDPLQGKGILFEPPSGRDAFFMAVALVPVSANRVYLLFYDEDHNLYCSSFGRQGWVDKPYLLRANGSFVGARLLGCRVQEEKLEIMLWPNGGHNDDEGASPVELLEVDGAKFETKSSFSWESLSQFSRSNHDILGAYSKDDSWSFLLREFGKEDVYESFKGKVAKREGAKVPRLSIEYDLSDQGLLPGHDSLLKIRADGTIENPRDEEFLSSGFYFLKDRKLTLCPIFGRLYQLEGDSWPWPNIVYEPWTALQVGRGDSSEQLSSVSSTWPGTDAYPFPRKEGGVWIASTRGAYLAVNEKFERLDR